MAPVNDQLYFAAMIACWRGHCPEAGVNIPDRVRDWTAKARFEEAEITCLSLLTMQKCLQ